MLLRDIILLKEGGAATGLPPVRLVDIEPTIKKVAEHLGIQRDDLFAIGTTGKKAMSGDIDLAIDETQHNREEIHNKMLKIAPGSKIQGGTNVGSYAFPIRGNPDLGNVQVDIMFVDHPTWAKFFWRGPAPEESKYKGAVRNIILMSAASAQDDPKHDWILRNKEGEIVARAGRSMSMKGLGMSYKYRPEKSPGVHLKTEKKIAQEEFKKLFPTAKFKHFETIKDPQAALDRVFGGGVSPEDVSTAEKVIKVIKRKFDKPTQERIFDKARKSLIDLTKKGLEVPPEVATK